MTARGTSHQYVSAGCCLCQRSMLLQNLTVLLPPASGFLGPLGGVPDADPRAAGAPRPGSEWGAGYAPPPGSRLCCRSAPARRLGRLGSGYVQLQEAWFGGETVGALGRAAVPGLGVVGEGFEGKDPGAAGTGLDDGAVEDEVGDVPPVLRGHAFAVALDFELGSFHGGRCYGGEPGPVKPAPQKRSRARGLVVIRRGGSGSAPGHDAETQPRPRAMEEASIRYGHPSIIPTPRIAESGHITMISF